MHEDRDRPVLGEPPACSFRYPVCVHRGKATADEAAAWLRALEEAYLSVVLALDAPAPLPDWGGASSGLDLYLAPEANPVRVSSAGVPLHSRDATAVFCEAGVDQSPRERAATLCVAEALAWTLDAAETPHARRAFAEFLWLLTGNPTSEDATAFDTVQHYPERALVADEVSLTTEGSALLFEEIEALYGAGAPGELAISLMSLSAGEPSLRGLRWTNEPDLVDVLRENFGRSPKDWSRFLGNLAVRRAELGTRSADQPVPSLEWLGDFGRVRFEWVMPLSTLPRRVAPREPIEPFGMTYLYVPFDESTNGLTLAFAAEWEGPVSFMWTLVTVDDRGRELARVEAPYLERATRVERTLVRFEGAAGVVVVGINLGDLSPTYPYDPDFAPYEPHGYTVHVTKL